MQKEGEIPGPPRREDKVKGKESDEVIVSPLERRNFQRRE